ncbi:ras-related protein Rab-13-like [Uloborus diversus]|uniref:ras-related protein Rab-13-like n=1 Tax=Uloborus diversus TaxID=327109 RepID=UPI00240989F7|nr:ras-related protein Rab-13-like [Uloborus diversus]
MMANNIPRIVFKILIIGDANVGKSCVLHRYAEENFIETIQPTVGVDYRPVYKTCKGRKTKLMIWDTAGQEKFKSITMSFYHGAHGALLTYDVTQRHTLYNLPKWLSELKRICGNIPIIIIGNKWDLRSKDRIPKEEIEAFIEELGYTQRHFLTSAYTSENIEENGAPPLIATPVTTLLKERNVLSRRFLNKWYPWSPDRTPCGFWL